MPHFTSPSVSRHLKASVALEFTRGIVKAPSLQLSWNFHHVHRVNIGGCIRLCIRVVN